MNSKFLIAYLVVGLICLVVLLLPMGIAPNVPGANYKNVTVWTAVNITNSKPEIMNVTVFESVNASARNITINAGSLKGVTCNISIREWNGFSDIASVNATLWHYATSTSNGTDDNNSHYTNTECVNNSDGSGFYVSYSCNFTVLYYSNNGTWGCNAIVVDKQNATTNKTGNTTFYPVYALNVTDGIDYGNVAVEDFSGNVTANVTNLGNMPINVTVHGYGARLNDGLAMNCSLGGNITIANERFSLEDVDWSSKTPLSGTPQLIRNLTMPKQNDSNEIVNSTYWQLYLDSTNIPGGNCTGHVVFTATVS